VSNGHGHDRGHDHHGHHHHAPSADADARWLAVALALIAGFMVVEIVGGLLASSLALLSDAGHMLTDAGAIGLALVAARLAARPAGGRFTFGLGRAEILSAQVNGATLLVLAGVIAIAAVQRLVSPPDVDGAFVLVIGLAGAAVNLAAAWALGRAERRSLNVEGARQHVVTDLYAALAAAAAGAVVLVAGWNRADGVAALIVAGLMVRSGWGLLFESGRILLEAAPRGMDPQAIGEAMAREPGVVEVHDLHVWEVTSGLPAISAHIIVGRDDDCHETRWKAARLLADRFGVEHTTLQVEHDPGDELLQIEAD
jgi:cobalt-zinc-cadmium efflux system protein